MTNINNLEFWLEQEGPQDAVPSGVPNTDAFTGPLSAPEIGAQAGNEAGEMDDPNVTNQGLEPPEDDFMQDPQAPDMPEIAEEKDFEIWRRDFFDLAIKGDPNEMMDAINQVRDRDLSPTQRKFVEDNFQILLLRQDANIDEATKEIRKLISKEMDLHSPGVVLLRHLNETLESHPLLNNIFIKLVGTYGMKPDLHRKFLASLFGCVQVGGGGYNEDLIYSEKEYSLNISTRFYTDYGNINLGKWSLEEDDPEKYLSESELGRLQEGSPEEKRVLRRRVILESIASRFEKRSFLVHVVNPENGMIQSIAWDISDSLRDGYKEGKFVVRKRRGDDAMAIIDDDGAIIPSFEYSIYYLRETGEVNERGRAVTSEESFLELRDSTLYINATENLIKEAGSGMSGMLFHETPYQGNPSDMMALIRCVPSLPEILLRRC